MTHAQLIRSIQEVTFNLQDLIDSETVIDIQLMVDEDAGQLSEWDQGSSVNEFLDEQITALLKIEAGIKEMRAEGVGS